MSRDRTPRTIFAISDLHLGGSFRPGWTGPGSRLCSRPSKIAGFIQEVVTPTGQAGELVLHGDIFDFLAEDLRDLRPELDPSLDASADAPYWLPFIRSGPAATKVTERLLRRRGDEREDGEHDAAVLDALRDASAAGVRLVLLVGNHDLELAHEGVRAALDARLTPRGGVAPHWVLDGEPYHPPSTGDVVFVHGNRYDDFNRVDYATLEDPARRSTLRTPAGSRLVARVMNPIKARWPFIDLLKPEVTAAIPLLLWLDPSRRDALADVAKLVLDAKGLWDDVDVSATSASEGTDPLESLLAQTFDERAPGEPEGDVSLARAAWGWVQLLTQGADQPLADRPLAPLRRALSPLVKRFAHRSPVEDAALDTEEDAGLRRHVRELWAAGARVVVAGHTHIARRCREDDRVYYNTGTWADVGHLDGKLLDLADEELRAWLLRLREPGPHWEQLVDTSRYYARIDLDADGRLGEHALLSHR